MKNSAKVTLLSFDITAAFLHDVMVSENDIPEVAKCSWCVCVGKFELILSVCTASRANKRHLIGSVFRKSLIYSMVYLTFAVIEILIHQKKAQKRCCSQLDAFEARTLV